jgi:hypothetical protein
MIVVGLIILIWAFIHASILTYQAGYYVSFDYLISLGPFRWLLAVGFFGLYLMGYLILLFIAQVSCSSNKSKVIAPLLGVQGYGCFLLLISPLVLVFINHQRKNQINQNPVRNSNVVVVKLIEPLKPKSPAPPAALPPPKIPPAATQIPGLLAYWPFEDADPATQVADQSGQSSHGRAVGAKTVEGLRGKGLLLNGETAFFDYGAANSLNFPARVDFTLALWVKTSSPMGVILSQRNRKLDGPDIDIFLARGRLEAHVRPDRGVFPLHVKTNALISDDQWHHCVLMRSGKNVDLYVDGKVAGRGSGKDVDGPITTDLRSLCREQLWDLNHQGMPRSLEATVDEFCIYSRSLEPEEIRTLAGR